jgi:DNA-binding transcriptional LysR family regulator
MLSMQEMITLLRRGEVDFCLSSPPVWGEEMECQIVCTDPIYVAVPAGHRLAGRQSVSLIELKDEWFAGVKKGYGIRDLVDSVCQSAGFTPQYVYEGDEPARLVALVEAGIGLAFIPGTAKNAQDNIVLIPVGDQGLVREIALLWLKSRYISQAGRIFRDVVIEYFDGNNEE